MARTQSVDQVATMVEQARLFFEPHLANLALSEQDIEKQDLSQLKRSLETLEELIERPEQLGFFRVKLMATGTIVLVQDRVEAQVEVGALPVLLGRKQRVLRRIQELTGGEVGLVENLVDLVAQVGNDELRTRLSSELDSLRKLRENSESIREEASESESEQLVGLLERVGQSRSGIFLVHGHDHALKQEVARLLERATSEQVTILSEQPNRGLTVVEKLEAYSGVRYAVVLLTPDDEVISGNEHRRRARQNVILELGLFLGLIGRSNVCVLYRSGTEVPSDYSGVLFIEADTLGGWKLGFLRELEEAGIGVNWRAAR